MDRYTTRLWVAGPVMAFIHPNPMDQSCWLYQMAHLSTWFRCIAIDIPGYGRSPKATAGLALEDIPEACGHAIARPFLGDPDIQPGRESSRVRVCKNVYVPVVAGV